MLCQKNKKFFEHIYNTLTFPCEKNKTVSFTSSRVKNIFAPSNPSRFVAKSMKNEKSLLDFQQVLVVYLNPLQSTYSFDVQLCSHLPDQ